MTEKGSIDIEFNEYPLEFWDSVFDAVIDYRRDLAADFELYAFTHQDAAKSRESFERYFIESMKMKLWDGFVDALYELLYSANGRDFEYYEELRERMYRQFDVRKTENDVSTELG